MSDNMVAGWEEFDKKMKELGDPLKQARIHQAALTFAVTPVVQQARLSVRKGSRYHKTHRGRLVSGGASSRSIRKKPYISRDRGVINVSVGFGSEFFYAGFYQVGFRRRGGKRVQADHSLKNVFNSRRGEMKSRYRQKLAQRLNAIAR